MAAGSTVTVTVGATAAGALAAASGGGLSLLGLGPLASVAVAGAASAAAVTAVVATREGRIVVCHKGTGSQTLEITETAARDPPRTWRHARRVPCQPEQVSTNRFHRQTASARRDTHPPGERQAMRTTGTLPHLAKPCPHGAAEAKTTMRSALIRNLGTALTVLALPVMAAAQTTGAERIDEVRREASGHLGPLYFTPQLFLKELGVDSNVFNAAGEPKSDFTFTVGPAC